MSVVALCVVRVTSGARFRRAPFACVATLAGIEADSRQSWSGSYVRLRMTTTMSVIAKMSVIP
jgi:hypothetical protein